MPDVAFKDLCVDVTAGDGRPEAVARFWGAALDQAVEHLDDGEYALVAPEGGLASRRVWFCDVPEPAAGKSRVHLDLRADSPDAAPFEALGGSLVRPPVEGEPWSVVADPDGVPLCVFGPHPQAPAFRGVFELVVDATDPEAIATWWAERTGGTVGRREDGAWAWVEGAAGFPWMFWVFTPVPEPKTVKNRVHWDVLLDDATVDDLVAAGATVLRRPDDEIDWTVLADPEGNEFCAFG